MQQIRKKIESKEIDGIICATAYRLNRWPKGKIDIGVVKDTAIHDIDLVRYLIPEEPTSVYATCKRIRETEVEDYSAIMLSFKSGKTAFLNSSWLAIKKTRTLTIVGSTIRVDLVTTASKQ